MADERVAHVRESLLNGSVLDFEYIFGTLIVEDSLHAPVLDDILGLTVAA